MKSFDGAKEWHKSWFAMHEACALRNIIIENFATGVVDDTVVLQRELRRFYNNANASVNFKINNYDTDKNTSL